MEKWYVDEYQIGWQTVPRSGPSLQRYPVSHGPFASEEEADAWALANLD